MSGVARRMVVDRDGTTPVDAEDTRTRASRAWKSALDRLRSATALHWGMRYDAVIIGGGIAGTSLSCFAAQRGMKVAVIEAEDHLGYHASGRSAAVTSMLDDNPTVQRLKRMGRAFFDAPPPGLFPRPVVDRRGTLELFSEVGWDGFEADYARALASGMDIQLLEPGQTIEHVPALEADAFACAVLVPGDGNLDVHEMLSSYRRRAEACGTVFHLGERVHEILVADGRCRAVVTESGQYSCDWVVDAAGAWVGEIAALAGATAIVCEPRRRCAVVFDHPPGCDVGSWPLVVARDHRFYFKPESGGLLFSPMDQVPQPPLDARADDETIAAGLQRLGQVAPTLVPTAVRRRWAGLRTFSPDDVPIVGRDDRRAGFFWLACQAGYGVETSGVLGQIAADLLVDGQTAHFDASLLSPARFT